MELFWPNWITMLAMKRIASYLATLMSVFLVVSCGVSDERVSADARPEVSAPIQQPLTEYPEVPEVSFDHNPSVFGKFEREVVTEYRLQEPDNKPDFVAPKHVKFEFAPGQDGRNAFIEVYPVEGFPQVYTLNKDSVKWIKDEIEAIKIILKNKDHRLDGDIPHLPFEDAGQHTVARVRHVPFRNGNGILFVMSWSHGIEFVNNNRLLYRYEGITDDGKYYVTAEMPIRVGFLPEDEGTERVDGYTWSELVKDTSTNSERLKKYYSDITDRLERLRNDEYHPALSYFEALVRSIKVGKS